MSVGVTKNTERVCICVCVYVRVCRNTQNVKSITTNHYVYRDDGTRMYVPITGNFGKYCALTNSISAL